MIPSRTRRINFTSAALFGYVLTRGLLLVAIIPPWQGTDEPGHMEYALVISSRAAAALGLAPGAPSDPGDEFQAPIIRSLHQHAFFRHTASPLPPPGTLRFENVPRLGTEVMQRGDETSIGYLPHAAALAVVPDGDIAEVLVRLRLVSIALVLALAALAWWVASRALPPPVAPAAAALVVAGPMVGFAGSIVSPDLTAAVLVAAWLAISARRMFPPDDGDRSGAMIAAWALVFLAAAAKRTALFVVPLAILAEAMIALDGRGAIARGGRSGVLGLGLPLGLGLRHRLRHRHRLGLGLGLGLGILLLIALGLTTRPGDPAGWQVAGTPWGDVRAADAARDGRWGFRIIDAAPDGWRYVERVVDVGEGIPSPERGRRVEVSAWMRRAPVGAAGGGAIAEPDVSRDSDAIAEPDVILDSDLIAEPDAIAEPDVILDPDAIADADPNPAAPHLASLVVNGIDDPAEEWSSDLVELPADGAWVPVVVEMDLDARTDVLRIALVPGDGTLEGVGAIDVDGVSLRLDGREFDINGGAERSTRRGTVWVRALARYTAAERLVDASWTGIGAPGAALARGLDALGFTFMSAWGGFGWLTLWPGAAHYALAALLTLFASTAVVIALVAPGRLVADPRRARFLRLCAVGAIIAVTVAVVGSVAGAAAHKQPQGRYLIPALLPVALPTAALAERVAPGRGPFALAALAFGLDVAAILWVMWPGFE